MTVFNRSFVVLISLLLVACGSNPSKPVSSEPKRELIHQDSTVYFAERKASISMRATFSHEPQSIEQELTGGYKLQFRSIHKQNISISQVSIIAGGRKISLTEGVFLVPPQKGVNLSLSLEDTQYISQQSDALLRFKYNGESQLISINNHQVSEFSIQ